MKYRAWHLVKHIAPEDESVASGDPERLYTESNAVARFAVFDEIKRTTVTGPATGTTHAGGQVMYDTFPVVNAALFTAGDQVEIQQGRQDGTRRNNSGGDAYYFPADPNDAGRIVVDVVSVDESAGTITVFPLLPSSPLMDSPVRAIYGRGLGGQDTEHYVPMKLGGETPREGSDNWWWQGLFNPRDYPGLQPGTKAEIESIVVRTLAGVTAPTILFAGDSITNTKTTTDPAQMPQEGGFTQQFALSPRHGKVLDRNTGLPGEGGFNEGFGVDSATTTLWLTPVTGYFDLYVEPLAVPIAPVVLMLGTNDAGFESMPAATFDTQLRALIAKFIAKGTPQIFLMAPPDWHGSSAGIRSRLLAYVTACEEIFNDTSEVVGFIDTFALTYDPVMFDPVGGNHPNDLGHTAIFNAIDTLLFGYYNPTHPGQTNSVSSLGATVEDDIG